MNLSYIPKLLRDIKKIPFTLPRAYLFMAGAIVISVTIGSTLIVANSHTVPNATESATSKQPIQNKKASSSSTPSTTQDSAASTPNQNSSTKPATSSSTVQSNTQSPTTAPKICNAFGQWTSSPDHAAQGIGAVSMRPGCTASMDIFGSNNQSIYLEPAEGSFSFADGSTQGPTLPYIAILRYTPADNNLPGFDGSTMNYSIKVKDDAQPGTYNISFSVNSRPGQNLNIFTVVLTIIN